AYRGFLLTKNAVGSSDNDRRAFCGRFFDREHRSRAGFSEISVDPRGSFRHVNSRIAAKRGWQTPQTCQRLQRIRRAEVHLCRSELDAVIQTVSKETKQGTIRLDGLAPLLHRLVILSLDQKALFLRKMIR